MSTNPAAFLQKENVRLKEENEALHDEIYSLREFVKALNDIMNMGDIKSDTELMPLLRDILSKALKLLNTPAGSLILVDEEAKELVFMLVYGELADNLTGYRMPIDDGIAGWVVKNAQPTLVRDVRNDPRFSHLVDDTFKFHTQSIASAPLIGNRKVYGVIEVLNRPGDEPFSETDRALLGLLCRAAGELLADIEQQVTRK